MLKSAILCKITVPKNRISIHLLRAKLDNAKGRRSTTGESEKGDGSFNTNHQATLWFHTRYFVLHRLPDFVQDVCFKTTPKEMEEYLLTMLEGSENRIMLESDWKQLYASKMLEEVGVLGARVDSRMISKSYMSFRRLLESRSKITRVFAWCPQTRRFERCIIPSTCAADILLRSDKVCNPVSTLNVVHLEAKSPVDTSNTPDVGHDATLDQMLYQLPSYMHGHTLEECIYYVVRCSHGGISINDILQYVGIRYKPAARILSSLEKSGIFKKEPVRSGKVLMYLYSIKGRTMIPKASNARSKSNEPQESPRTAAHMEEASVIPKAMHAESDTTMSHDSTKSVKVLPKSARDSELSTAGVESTPSVSLQSSETGFAHTLAPVVSEGAAKHSGNVSSPSDFKDDSSTLPYKEWLLNERDLYATGDSYANRFIELFGGDFQLPKAVNTTVFRNRMVLLTNYVEYFKAASCATLSSFYRDMENSSTKVDRKTVMRVADFVIRRRPHICMTRSQDLEGVNFALTVLYDSRQLSGFDAFQLVNEDIAKKRHLVSTHCSSLRSRINKSFKGPQDLPDASSLPTPASVDATYTGPLTLESPMLVKDIEVTQQQNASTSGSSAITFSQRCLSNNGYIFPVITRVKCFHRFLLEMDHSSRFSALNVLHRMPMDLYLQIIGCGYELNNVFDLFNGNISSIQQDIGMYDAIFKGRKSRDPVYLIHRMLTILSNLKLVKRHHEPLDPGSSAPIPECKIEWEVLRSVTLQSLANPDVLVGRFDLLTSCDEFWMALQSEVDGYISLNIAGLPDHMAVQELFSKKNWKGLFCVDTKYRTQLDHGISSWLRMTCQGMDYHHLMKFMYMPPYIMKAFMHRHCISQESLLRYISHHVRNNGGCVSDIPAESSMESVVQNLSPDEHYLWLAKFVLAERLCNATFYERFNSIYDNSVASTITWGSLREKLKRVRESTSPRNKRPRQDSSNRHIGDDVPAEVGNCLALASVATANSAAESCGNVSSFGGGIIKSSTKPVYCIWDFLSIMFDGMYSPSQCRYIFEHIMHTSSFSLRTLTRLREQHPVDVIRCALKCRLPIYGIVTNRRTPHDHVKAILKCMLFSPVVCIRPWFLDKVHLLKRGRSILRQWSENGWITRTKQPTSVSILFKLSILSRVKLFGKLGDIHFMANVLASHINRDFEVSQSALCPIGNSGSIGSSCAPALAKGGHLATNSSISTGGYTCNSEGLGTHSTYSLIENWVNGLVSFSPEWRHERWSSNRESKRAKLSYDRLNDGGLSRHLREMTPDVISITSVNVTICQEPSVLNPRELMTGKWRDRSMLLDSIIPKDLICGSRFSEVLNPLGCPSLMFTSRLSGHYPLCNFEYTSDRDNEWWTDRNYVAVLFPVDDTSVIVPHDMSSPLDTDGSTTNGHLVSTREGLYSAASPPTAGEKREIDPNSLDDIILRVIRARFDEDSPMVEGQMLDANSYLYDLVRIIMLAGKDGLVESSLRRMFLTQVYRGDSGKVIALAEGRVLVGDAVFEVLILTAEIIRFATKVPSNEEFIYLYWEFSAPMCITVQPIVAVRHYTKCSKVPVSDCMPESPLERPAYITPLMWMLYEDSVVGKLKEDVLAQSLGRLNSLLSDREIQKEYMAHRLRAPLGAFISIDGHINRCLLAFLMLRIASMLKAVPGQSLQEVWEKVVILDLCEVDLVLRSMMSLGMCRRSIINAESGANSCWDGGDSTSSRLALYFMREESRWLPKFAHVLLPFSNY
ncbi:hypothetical protein X943_001230 [Babesia divergens]|uniref:B-block binding subunit of TFIIIC domain-containing protein n=1 Tax=Babesia divergens TaxID=32595 RepID=A0AAD9G6Q0_BABDI|nr:hypothetical protein X943_001230 [Babesia divergens]